MTCVSIERLKEIKSWFGKGFYLAIRGCDIETRKQLENVELMPFCHDRKKKSPIFLVKASLIGNMPTGE
jgi:hypothetical protein